MALRLAEIVIYVHDVPAAIEWYRDVLGLRLVWEHDGVAELDADGFAVHLHDLPPDVESRPPLTAFTADDIDAEVAAVNERGGDLPEILDEGWGRITRFTDPEGNPLCIEKAHER